MQLTRAADYAVRVMIHLARQPEGAIISKTILAKVSETPESFLSKILQALARAGMIQARRGVVGGFTLLPRGAEASLLDVIESIDGPISLNICLNSGVSCHRQPDCAAHQIWQRAQSAMLAVLREAMIAEMAAAEKSCCGLLHIEGAADGGNQGRGQASRQSGPPAKSKNTARLRPAASRPMRVTGKKQNSKNNH
jgi:Rrf2 family protein